MQISEQERQAIRRVVDYGAEWGYGNLMAHLASAWALRLMSQGVSKEAAIAATQGRNPYPLKLHIDILERGEWDETGARYSEQKAGPQRKKAAKPRSRKARSQ